jgi:hypothetical protein
MAWQPGIGADIALLSSAAMDICIGHSPVKPLAASPLMGSAAQSNRRSNVRRNLMARIIVEPFYPCTRKFVARVGDRTQPSLELFADGCVRGRNRTRLRWQQRISPDTAKSRGPDNVDTSAYLLGTVIAAVYFQEKAVTPVQGALRRRLTGGTDLFPVKVAA